MIGAEENSRSDGGGATVAHLAAPRRVLDVVLGATTGLDVAQVDLLVQDLNLANARERAEEPSEVPAGGAAGRNQMLTR